MVREDFYTGEPVANGSPPFFQNLISEQEAVENASFGKYDYDPSTRMMMTQPMSIYPGGYGYNYNMNPQVGIGSVPYGYGNPALQYQQQMMYQQQQQMMQSNQQVEYFIKPVNFGGNEYLPTSDYNEDIERMKMEYWQKEQEEFAKGVVNNSNNPYYGAYNYYGVPYFNPYQYNSLKTELNQKIDQIKEEARENRINFNIQIAKLAHNIAGDVYNEQELEERYRGKYVQSVGGIPPMTYAEIYNQNRFNNLVPFDNSQFYRDQYAATSKEYNDVIPQNASLKECFDGMGIVSSNYELEEEAHRRRDGGALYNSSDNSYKYFVRAKAAERFAKANGNSLVNTIKHDTMNNFPTLSQSAKLLDDGTLNITCNFGSRAGQVYSVHNSQEAGYEQDRERFTSFLNSIPGSVYLDSPNPSS